MTKKYRPITGSEKAKQIGLGVFLVLIFAGWFSFIAPWVFSWAASFFDSTPDALRDCQIKNYLEKTLKDIQACWSQSDSYEAKVKRLGAQIPWFWVFCLVFGWAFLRHPLMGRIRDDSDDISYDGEGVWDFVLQIIFQIVFYIAIWAFIARDRSAFIALGLGISALILWHLIDKWLRKRFGKPKGLKGK